MWDCTDPKHNRERPSEDKEYERKPLTVTLLLEEIAGDAVGPTGFDLSLGPSNQSHGVG